MAATRPPALRTVWRPPRALRVAVGLILAACTSTTTRTEIGPGASGLLISPASNWAADPRIGLRRDTALAALLAEVSPTRLRTTDSTLVAFGTRNTLSDTLSVTRGIGAARRWLHDRLSAIARDCGGCLRVEYDAGMIAVPRHPAGISANVVNVLGVLPGRDTMRVVVMGGHYDSCICSATSTSVYDATSDAPGADDDGSGSSAVLELARVLAARYPRGLEATVIFALYAGEEQGLLGSIHLAERLRSEGKTVVAAMTDDIIGNVVAEDGSVDSTSVRIFAADPDSGQSRELGRHAWAVGTLYLPALDVRPIWRLDRIWRAGDHVPFVRAGWPGLRFTERLENYKRQHLPSDDLAHVNFGYVAQVARFNAATVVSLASAPATPDTVVLHRESTSGGQSWAISWTPVRGAVAYEVLLRRTTAPTWERVMPATTTTRVRLDVQLDDAWAAVRAVGANGHRSLPRAGAPPRPTSTPRAE
ncbi:MAG TPA: M28 family peptidase [Gemmatimonadaceae bacterium]|nr:M28 family peptidase [Gemmatimonadaceae bacterium]